LTSKDSISVASNRNSRLSSPVGTFDISLSRHFQVFENIKVPTSGPSPGIVSFLKVSACFSHKKLPTTTRTPSVMAMAIAAIEIMAMAVTTMAMTAMEMTAMETTAINNGDGNKGNGNEGHGNDSNQ